MEDLRVFDLKDFGVFDGDMHGSLPYNLSQNMVGAHLQWGRVQMFL